MFRLIASLILLSSVFLTQIAIGKTLSLESIANSATWLKLLHYKRSHLTGHQSRSQLAGEDFFLSAQGKSDPLGELEATLNALRNPQKPVTSKQMSASCLFPARAAFLSETLQERFPRGTCPDLDSWLEALDPTGVTIIFASAYSSNPASLFGHTMLRIDSSQNRQLLSYAVHYAAANNPNDNPIVYMTKGLTGGYPGFFMLTPYHDMISLYADGESRDLWEYKLNLSEAETLFLSLHLWELLNTTWAPYWFFDENCAYALLSLIEVARPQTRLLDRFPGVVIPWETIRALQNEGFISDDARRRPSRKADSSAWLARLSLTDRLAAFHLASAQDLGKIPSTPVLDGAIAILDFRKMKNHGILNPVEQKNSILLKEMRAQRSPDTEDLKIQEAAPPDKQAPSQKVLGGAQGQDGKDYGLLSYFYGLHSQMDPSIGYEPWESIDYMGFDLLFDAHTARIDRLLFIEVQSLTPWTWLDPRFAWRAYLGASRFTNSLVPELAGNIGSAFTPHKNLLIYALFGLRLFPTSQVWHRKSGVTGSFGMQWNLGDTRIRFFGEELYAPWSLQRKDQISWSLEAQYDFSKRFSLDIQRRYDGLRRANSWQLTGIYRF